ncbi:hypothetical protein AC1031_018148 [Aphanomyces cochlioides]|nr:hypothetical protein AC1031_018148 [Aphanomyces cochlioides]
MEDRLAQLTQSLDQVHRRLDALERQVQELPERLGRAMGLNAGAAADGAQVFNLIVQAISTSIIQTVTDNLRITAPNAPRSQSPSTDTSPKESVRPLSSLQNNSDTPYNAVPMHHISSRSPMSPEPAPMASITRECQSLHRL